MSDYFSFEAVCKKCGFDLSNCVEAGFGLMMPIGESVELTCPKCGTVWRFRHKLSTRQEKVGTKKSKKVAEKANV